MVILNNIETRIIIATILPIKIANNRPVTVSKRVCKICGKRIVACLKYATRIIDGAGIISGLILKTSTITSQINKMIIKNIRDGINKNIFFIIIFVLTVRAIPFRVQ